MTHDTFVARCKYLTTQLHRDQCKDPNDELRPFLFVVPDPGNPANVETLPIPPLAMHPEIKARTFEGIGEFVRAMGSPHVAFTCEAWIVSLPADSSLAIWVDRHPADPMPGGQMPSQRPDRVEVVQLAAYSADAMSHYTAEIVRPLVGRPALKAWDGGPCDDQEKWTGQLSEPLRQAVSA